jgi:hypothetical protein
MKTRLILALLLAGPAFANAEEVPAIENTGAVVAGDPVLYRVGAGGVTFRTPKAEAERRLGAPVNRDTTFVSHYANGMWVVWNDEPPRTPYSMGVEPGYAGELALPAPYGGIRINDLLKEPYTAEDPLGLGFLRELYRFHEGASADYDCVEEGTCRARKTPDRYFVLAIPRMNLLVYNGILVRIVLKSE